MESGARVVDISDCGVAIQESQTFRHNLCPGHAALVQLNRFGSGSYLEQPVVLASGGQFVEEVREDGSPLLGSPLQRLLLKQLRDEPLVLKPVRDGIAETTNTAPSFELTPQASLAIIEDSIATGLRELVAVLQVPVGGHLRRSGEHHEDAEDQGEWRVETGKDQLSPPDYAAFPFWRSPPAALKLDARMKSCSEHD